MTFSDEYEKALDTVKAQFQIASGFSRGNQAAWLQEVEHLLNQAKADLESHQEYNYGGF